MARKMCPFFFLALLLLYFSPFSESQKQVAGSGPKPPPDQDLDKFLCPTLDEVVEFKKKGIPINSVLFYDEPVVRLLVGCQEKYKFTYGQLQQYVDYIVKNFRAYTSARQVPLCLLSEDAARISQLRRYEGIFRDLDKKEEEYNKETDPLLLDKLGIYDPKNKTRQFGVKDIQIRKFAGKPDIIHENLHQWISVRIKFDKPLEGIIVQSVEGFLGLPFGEFRADFDCECEDGNISCPDDEIDITTYPDLAILNCKYRPKNSLRHPQMLVVGGSRTNSPPTFTEFGFQFNWINVNCHDVAAFQFLIITVENAATPKYETFLTPVYEMKYSDTLDGVPTHSYHVRFQCFPNDPIKDPKVENKVAPSCQKEQENCKTDKDSCIEKLIHPCSFSYIPYSRVYDQCILGITKSDDGESCPPGPFLCTLASYYKEEKAWLAWRSEKVALLQYCYLNIPRHQSCKLPLDQELFHHVHKPIDTPPVHFGDRQKRSIVFEKPVINLTPEEDIEIGASSKPEETSFLDMEIAFEQIGVRHYKINKRFHGLMMIIAFLVINPLSAFIARYFKETEAWSCFETPTWLMAHIVLSIGSLFTMWLGIVSVLANLLNGGGIIDCGDISNDSDIEELFNLCGEHQGYSWHLFSGALAVLSFHLSAIVAWTRPSESRGMYITTHSFSAYFAQIAALLSILLVNGSVCQEIMFEAVLLFIVAAIIFVTGCVVQIIQDVRLKVKRHWFPVAEGLKVREVTPPCHWIKVLVLLLGIVLHIALGFLIILSYQVINQNDMFAKDSRKPDGLNAYLIDLIWIKDCKLINSTTLLDVARTVIALDSKKRV